MGGLDVVVFRCFAGFRTFADGFRVSAFVRGFGFLIGKSRSVCNMGLFYFVVRLLFGKLFVFFGRFFRGGIFGGFRRRMFFIFGFVVFEFVAPNKVVRFRLALNDFVLGFD